MKVVKVLEVMSGGLKLAIINDDESTAINQPHVKATAEIPGWLSQYEMENAPDTPTVRFQPGEIVEFMACKPLDGNVAVVQRMEEDITFYTSMKDWQHVEGTGVIGGEQFQPKPIERIEP